MRHFVIMLGCIIYLYGESRAFVANVPMPLHETIERAQIVVVARVDKFVVDLKYHNTSIPEMFVGMDAFTKPGRYTFQVLRTLKGQCEVTLELNLPELLKFNYGYTQLEIQEGNKVLLLLQPNSQGQLVPVNSDVPLIRLSDNQKLDTDEGAAANGLIQSRVIKLLLVSLADSNVRQINTFLMRDIADPQMVIGLSPYLNDQNVKVQDNILYCMAINQQVIVIPRIVQLADKFRGNKSSANSVRALTYYNTSEAVPYLNPLLFNHMSGIRLNTMMSLPKLADQSSIPYLLLALYDPEWQQVVPHFAYNTLHRFNTAAPFIKADDFYANPNNSIRLMYAWWQDELAGKHTTPDAPALPSSKTMPNSANLTPQQAVPLLNPLLFERSLNTRQQAMTALAKLADQSSIPYLLIALYDPDKGVAYAAYQTLHRLISEVGPAKPQVEFVAQQEMETKPLYEWWQDELRGLHTTDTSALISIAERDKGGAYKAYRRLHQLVPELGATKDEATFYAHPKDEIQALEQWRSEQWKKAHPQPVAAPAAP